jgi:hypothetical protein
MPRWATQKRGLWRKAPECGLAIPASHLHEPGMGWSQQSHWGLSEWTGGTGLTEMDPTLRQAWLLFLRKIWDLKMQLTFILLHYEARILLYSSLVVVGLSRVSHVNCFMSAPHLISK